MSNKLPIDARLKDGIAPFEIKAELPVNRWAIRRWCAAMGVDYQPYLDPERVEAPLAMLHFWTVWEVTRSPMSINQRLRAEMTAAGYPAIVATNYELEQFRPARIGETLRTRIRLEDISQEKQTPLGAGYFATELHEFLGESAEILGQLRIRCLFFKPGAPPVSKPDSGGMKPPMAASAPEGLALAKLDIPVSATTIIAGALAFNDFELVHHDRDLARAQGLPDIIMNSATSIGLVYRYLTETAPANGHLTAISMKLGAPCVPGDTLCFSGRQSTDSSFEIRATTSRGEHLKATARFSSDGKPGV
jgi:acyl dehydratase